MPYTLEDIIEDLKFRSNWFHDPDRIKVWNSCLIGLLNHNCWTLLIYLGEEFTDTVSRGRKTFPSVWMNLSHSKVKKDSRKKRKHTNFKTYELLYTFKKVF